MPVIVDWQENHPGKSEYFGLKALQQFISDLSNPSLSPEYNDEYDCHPFFYQEAARYWQGQFFVSLANKVNSAIYKDERISDVFITLSIVSLNKNTKTLKYAGAGDLPIIYKSDTTKSVKSNGILLGFNESGQYEDCEIILKSNESIYLITDGIPETRCTDGDFYREGRLKETIAGLSETDDPLDKIISHFIWTMRSYFPDDIIV